MKHQTCPQCQRTKNALSFGGKPVCLACRREAHAAKRHNPFGARCTAAKMREGKE